MIKLFRPLMLVVIWLGLSQVTVAGGLDFVKNGRQWPQQVQYKAGLPGGSVFFTTNSFVYSYYSIEDMEQVHESLNDKSVAKQAVRWHAYRVLFPGSSPSVTVSGNDKKSHYHNYFLGSDPSTWSAAVPVYESIRYKELYPGIDLAVYSQGNAMKYDFIAAPGTDPSVIRLKFEGVEPKLTKNGSLELRTSVNTVIEEAPYVYQLVNRRKLMVKCNYALNTNGEICFVFPEGYDRNQPLVIDPTLVFVTWSGATQENWSGNATYDAAGNFYTTSQVNTGWPVTLGAFQTLPGGGGFGLGDIGINKYNSNGSALIYSTYLGGNGSDGVINIQVNNNNELVVLGSTESANFPTTPGCFQSAFGGGGRDFFLTHFNAGGTALVGATYIGGTDQEETSGGDLRFDQQGNIICAGNTGSADFPVTPGAYQPVYNGGTDGCIFKINSSCTALLFSTYIGGSGADFIESLVTTNSGNIVVCGGTTSTDYPTTPGALLPVAPGGDDGYVSVLNGGAATLLSSTYVGTASKDNALKVQVDTGDNIYVAGFTKGVYPVTAGLYNNPNGAFFLHKLGSLLTGIQSTRLGGDTAHITERPPFAFLVDDCGYVYYSIFTGDVNLAVTAGAYQTNPATMYMARLTPDMTALSYATYLGSVNDGAHSHGQATFDRNGTLYTSLCMNSFAINTPGAWRPVSMANGLLDGLSFKFRFDQVITHAMPGVSGNDTGCAPFTVQFANNSSNATSYLWEFGDGTTSTAFAPVHTYALPGTYYAVLKAYNPASCKTEDADSLVITVLAHDTVYHSADAILCEPGPLVLHAPVGYPDVQWQDGSANPSLPVTAGGTYFAVSKNMCRVRIDTFQVEAIDLVFSLGPDTTVCSPYLLAGDQVADASYLWNTGSTAPQILTAVSDRYWLKVSKKGCSFADTVMVNYKANRTTTADILFCNNQPFSHRLKTTIPPGSTALWSTGSTDAQIVVRDYGTYWVRVTNGTCYNSDTTHVVAEYCDCTVFVPTAFSPNNDGINDQFRAQLPSGCDFSNFTLSVYNRWGQRIFITSDPLKGWDGTSNGVAADQGVYMYLVDGYAGSKRVHKQYKGDVTLIR